MPFQTLPSYRTSNLVHQLRRLSSAKIASASHRAPSSDESLPSIPICPPSSCGCAPMPEGLAIDHEKQMNGTIPPYAQHVVICTGRHDWSSRIEDELPTSFPGGDRKVNLARSLKKLVGRGGKYFDHSKPILITNNSQRPFTKSGSHSTESDSHTVYIFPENVFIPTISNTPEAIEGFVQRFLTVRDNSAVVLNKGKKRRVNWRDNETNLEYIKLRSIGPERSDWIGEGGRSRRYNLVDYPTILICGHNARDTRCGILGPILLAEFQKYFRNELRLDCKSNPLRHINVALTSHVGGHAYAGNVVIYIPPGFHNRDANDMSPLAGRGVWYGRVEPRHVEGIMEETIKGGKIIQELLRGVHPPQEVSSLAG